MAIKLEADALKRSGFILRTVSGSSHSPESHLCRQMLVEEMPLCITQKYPSSCLLLNYTVGNRIPSPEIYAQAKN